jgi:hypothetical protein
MQTPPSPPSYTRRIPSRRQSTARRKSPRASQRTPYSVRGHRPRRCPLAQRRDLLGHHDGERRVAAASPQEVLVVSATPFGERGVERGHDDLLDLGAAEAAGGGATRSRLEGGRGPGRGGAGGCAGSRRAFRRRAGRRRRSRRSGPCAGTRAAVSTRRWRWRRRRRRPALLEPGQERAEHAQRQAAVLAAAGGERLLQLVDEEHARRDASRRRAWRAGSCSPSRRRTCCRGCRYPCAAAAAATPWRRCARTGSCRSRARR